MVSMRYRRVVSETEVTYAPAMSQQIPSQGPLTDGPHDPEHDPTASYALEPDHAAALTRRVRSSSGETVLVRSPLGGQPLAHVPQSSDDDVREAFARARRARTNASRTSSSLDCGTCASGWPPRGDRTRTVSPEVLSTRRVSAPA